MKEYHELYFKFWCFVTGDVLESFESVCLKCYWLDLCHYFSILSWDVTFKMMGVSLESISDISTQQFIEKSVDVFYIT